MFSFIMILLIMLLASIFLSKHPMVLAQSLILFSALTSFQLWALHSPWLFVVNILVFVGGVMVMILYLSALMNNEKMTFNYFMKSMLLLILMMVMFFKFKETKFHAVTFNYFLYEKFYSILFIFMMFYILFTLLSVTKIMESYRGALKKF